MPPLPATHSERRTGGADRLLPFEGRTAPAPPWPSGHTPSDPEALAWSRLWALPQACAWEALNLSSTVETYCRLGAVLDVQLDAGDPSAALLAQHVRLANDLGLTPASMARLRWTVATAPTPPAAKRRASTSAAPVRRLRPQPAPE